MLNKNQINVLEHLNGYVEGQTVTWTSDMELTISKVLELVNNKESTNIDVVTNRLLDIIDKLTMSNKLLNGNDSNVNNVPEYVKRYGINSYQYQLQGDLPPYYVNGLSPNQRYKQHYKQHKSRQTGSKFNKYLRNSDNPNVFQIPPIILGKSEIILSLILAYKFYYK